MTEFLVCLALLLAFFATRTTHGRGEGVTLPKPPFVPPPGKRPFVMPPSVKKRGGAVP